MKLFSRHILIKSFLPIFSALVLFAGIAYAVWTEPTVNPPGGNVDVPINVGPTSQYKSGALGIGGLFRTSFLDRVPHAGESNSPGSVLTLKNAVTGETAWAAAQSSSCGGAPTEISSKQSSATFASAATRCRDMGACWHLPSLDELGIFAGKYNDSTYLWTTSLSNSSDALSYGMRLSDGKVRDGNQEDRDDCKSNCDAFRCVR
jgi:hypothetical protein